MTDRFIRVPPDSTGKRSSHALLVEVPYINRTGDLLVKSTVTGQVTGTFGTIASVIPSEGDDTQGLMDVVIDTTSDSEFFSGGENLIIDTVPVAEVNGAVGVDTGTDFYYGKSVIAGSNNPLQGAFVDNKGQLFTRNAEGAQQYDAVGLARTSTPNIVGDYRFEYGLNVRQWSDLSVGGVQSDLPDESAIALDVSTASGEVACIRTDLYHRYQSGQGTTIEFNVVAGDTGKANVVREWGYGDDQNGLFWRQEENTVSVLIRSSASGTVEEVVVPQSEWNSDRLDGVGSLRNLSNTTLDTTKRNLYWIDFAWLGAANVRFGVYSGDGSRVTAHIFKNPQGASLPFMATAQLPVQFRIENTGVSASPSRLKATCSVVFVDGQRQEDRERLSDKTSHIGVSKAGITTETPIFSLRAGLTFNGKTNRRITIPELFSFRVDGNAIIRLRKNGTLTGPSFSTKDGSSAEYDDSASAVSGGEEVITWVLNAGAYNIETLPNFGILGENIKVLADGSVGDIYTLTCEGDGGSVTARGGMTWIDID